MATFNYYLHRPNDKGPRLIQLYVHWGKNRLKYTTKISIESKYWNKKDSGRSWIKGPQASELNFFLQNMITNAQKAFRELINDLGRDPKPMELREKLDETYQRVEVVGNDLFSFFKEHIARMKWTHSNKTVQWYENTLAQLKELGSLKNVEYNYDDINMDFYFEFLEFLEEKGYTANTVGKHIQNLKAVMRAALSENKHNNQAFTNRNFKKPSEESDTIYLNLDELTAMEKLDLNERLAKVRDLFLVGCWTGLRFSDLSALTKQNFKDGNIHVKQKKTGKEVVIPILPVVKDIMSKYKDRPNNLPPVISGDKTRAYLREIGEMIPELHEIVTRNVTRGGRQESEMVKKYELIGTHTARRSFATNHYELGVDTFTIMAITGHKTETAFMKYLRTSPKRHAKSLKEFWDEKEPLKKVN